MARMRFGIFLPGFHCDVEGNVASAFERDVEVLQLLDRLGYHEAWVGEHHSGGAELICDPGMFIAHAAAHTKHIDLGVGVVSLPYHNPLWVADRMIMLDHLTRGRMILGVGAGGLPSDAAMIGLDPRELRPALEHDVGVLMHLLNSEEPISVETPRYKLVDAVCQLAPYSQPIRMAVAGIASTTGARLAGRYGMALLSLGATSPEGFEALATQWGVIERNAEEHGQPKPDRKDWRLVGPMHIAETRAQAIEDVRYGLVNFAKYTRDICATPNFRAVSDDFDTLISWINDTGLGVVGTPDDAIRQLERLEKQSGGFGTFLMLHGEWANRAATQRHFELFAEYVMPAVQGTNRRRKRTQTLCKANLAVLDAQTKEAVDSANAKDKSGGRAVPSPRLAS